MPLAITIVLAAMVMESGPQLKVMAPPPANAASTALLVQLSGVPSPTTPPAHAVLVCQRTAPPIKLMRRIMHKLLYGSFMVKPLIDALSKLTNLRTKRLPYAHW